LGRAVLVATIAAVAITTVASSAATAGALPTGKAPSATSSGVTDISARRRHYHGGGGAAAAAAFAGIVGTGLAIAATQSRRDDYDRYYYGRPVYAPAPSYYGSGPYYHRGYPNGAYYPYD